MNLKNIVSSQSQKEPKSEKRWSQSYLWVWPVSNGACCKLTHGNSEEPLRNYINLGWKGQRDYEIKSPVDPQSCVWRNQEKKATPQAQTWILFLKKKMWIINVDLGGSRAPGLIPILEYRLNLNYLNIFWLFHYIVRSKNEGLCLAYPLFQVDDEIKQR